mgnify:CR=1 FL=1
MCTRSKYCSTSIFEIFSLSCNNLFDNVLTLFNTIIFVDVLNLRFSPYIFGTKVIV